MTFSTSVVFSATHSGGSTTDRHVCRCLKWFSDFAVAFRWSSLFQAVAEEKRRSTVLSSLTFSSSMFPPDLLFLSSPPVPTLFFHTSACIIFSAVNFFQSTSPTLCYASLLLLPATKVVTVNDRRCYSDTILGVWGLFLPIRSVKSFFFRFLPELPSLNTSCGEGNTAVKKWRLF